MKFRKFDDSFFKMKLLIYLKENFFKISTVTFDDNNDWL